MRKFAGLTLATLALSALSFTPAQAAEGDDPFIQVVKAPITISALISGMAVGTPIAVMHDTISSYSSARNSIANQLGGESADVTQHLVADIAAVPACLTVGLVDGTCHGVGNAVKNCSEKPFSAESFCMKESCY